MKGIKLENSPVKLARKILLGTMLGDSWIKLTSPLAQRNYAKRAFLIMTHSNSQFEYLIWKARKLVPLVGKFNILERPTRFGGKETGGFHCKAISLSSKYLKHIWDDFYFKRNGNIRKEVHMNVLNRLTPVSLAVWYGDDGSLHPEGYVRIATNSFSKSEVELICRALEKNFGIVFTPHLHYQNNSYGIRADLVESKKFLELVSPYLGEIQCLRHKLSTDFKASSDQSARHPRKNYWDDEIFRTPQNVGRHTIAQV